MPRTDSKPAPGAALPPRASVHATITKRVITAVRLAHVQDLSGPAHDCMQLGVPRFRQVIEEPAALGA